MSSADLRPRAVTELVDAAFQLLRRHYRAFVTIAAITALPTAALQTTRGALIAGSDGVRHTVVMETRTADSTLIDARAVDTSVGAVGGGALGEGLALAGSLAALALALVGGTAQTILADQALRTGDADVAAALRRGVRRAWRVVLATVVYMLAAVTASVALFIPGIYVLFRGITASTAAALEDGPIGGVLSRTWARGRGRVWHAIGVMALVLLLYGVLLLPGAIVGGVVTAAAGAAAGLIATAVSQAVVNVLVAPLITIATTLLYYDQRIRSEGYDLEVLAAGLEAMPGAGVQAPDGAGPGATARLGHPGAGTPAAGR